MLVSAPTRNNQNMANITQTWGLDDIEDTMNVNACDTSDVESDSDVNVNYIAFMSNVSSGNADSASRCYDNSENECSDVLDYKKMYASKIRKCLKLGKAIDKLNTKIESLNT